MGLTVREEYGGPGRDIVSMMIFIEELSRRSLAVVRPLHEGVVLCRHEPGRVRIRGSKA